MSLNEQQKSKQQQNLLRALRNNKDLCDVTFIIGRDRKIFETNRVFLSTISPVFKAMLFGNMQESQINAQIEIDDIDSNAFEQILNYSYCSQPSLTPNNIISIRKICQKYQISLVSEIADEFFAKCLNQNNICSLLSQSVNLKLLTFVQCIQMNLMQQTGIGQFAKQIVKTSQFLQLPPDGMVVFLQCDGLNIKEEQLLESTLKWVDYQASNRNFNGQPPPKKKQKTNHDMNEIQNLKSRLLKTVIPCIRFGLMDGKYFVKKVKPLNILSVDEIASISCYILCGDGECGKFETKPRAFKEAEPEVYIMKELLYYLSMSSKFEGLRNDGDSLRNKNLTQGCGTKREYAPWIEIEFEVEMEVRKMEIGAAAKEMIGQWGEKYLNGAYLEFDDKGEWKRLFGIDGIQAFGLRSYNLNISTKKMRIIRGEYCDFTCFLGIGCWKVYGYKKTCPYLMTSNLRYYIMTLFP